MAIGIGRTPILLGFLDDHSRLASHLQWYLARTAEVFVDGLWQALMKRGVPRTLMTDNRAPMMAGEVRGTISHEEITGRARNQTATTPRASGRAPATATRGTVA